MKTIIWSLVVIASLFWTGASYLAARLTHWLAEGLAAGGVRDPAAWIAQWPMPPWMGQVIDPAWAEWLRDALIASSQVLVEALPILSTVASWLAPLVWVLWAIGLLVLIALGALAHWLAGQWKTRGPGPTLARA